MIRDLTISVFVAILFLVWFMPSRPPLTVTPIVEQAAIKIVKER